MCKFLIFSSHVTDNPVLWDVTLHHWVPGSSWLKETTYAATQCHQNPKQFFPKPKRFWQWYLTTNMTIILEIIYLELLKHKILEIWSVSVHRWNGIKCSKTTGSIKGAYLSHWTSLRSPSWRSTQPNTFTGMWCKLPYLCSPQNVIHLAEEYLIYFQPLINP